VKAAQQLCTATGSMIDIKKSWLKPQQEIDRVEQSASGEADSSSDGQKFYRLHNISW